MNILEQWRFSDEQKKNMTPAMIARSEAIVKFKKYNIKHNPNRDP